MLRRKKYYGQLGLEMQPFIAPTNFDRSAEAVDVYSIFCNYYLTDRNAKFAYSFTNDISTLTLTGGSGLSFRWGETIAGVDYVYNVASGTAFTAGSTKRYVIHIHTSSTIAAALPGGAIWGYCGLRIVSVTSATSNNSYLKYIHFARLSTMTSLGNFRICIGLSTGVVNIPITATSLVSANSNSFAGTNVTLTEDTTNTVLKVINGVMYQYSGADPVQVIGTTTSYTNSNLTFASTITSIASYAYYLCTGITGNLVIPSTITNIRSHSFNSTSNLTGTLSLPNTLTALGDNAFMYSGLTGALVLPDSLTVINTSAFYNCTGFTSLTLGNAITSIGTNTFQNCSGLTGALVIPNSVTSLGASAFYNCYNMTGSLTLPNGLTTIGGTVFVNCAFTGTLTIPNSVTSLGTYAFQGCSGFTGLSIGTGLTTLGSYVFNNCYGLTGDLTIPNNITVIEEGTFKSCYWLTGTLTLPNALTALGYRAFIGCKFTGTITLPSTLTSIGTLDNGVINGNPFGSHETITFVSNSSSFVIENNIIYNAAKTRLIGTCRLYNVAPTIASTVTIIERDAFYYSNMSGILEIPASVTSIRANAFYYNPELTRVNLRSATAPIITPTSVAPDTMGIWTNLGSNKFHVPVTNSGYNIAPWTSYGTVTNDL